MSWRVVLSKRAAKDARKLNAAGLRPEAEQLLLLLEQNPFHTPPPYKKLNRRATWQVCPAHQPPTSVGV